MNYPKLFFATLLLTISASSALAYVAGSANYRIEFDSLNVLGGTSSSATYKLTDTGGELATGTSTSATYNLRAGFQAMRYDETLSVTLPGTITFAKTDVSTSGLATTTATWTISSTGGYEFYVKANNSPAMQPNTSNPDSGTIGNATLNGATVPASWEFSSDTAAEFGFQPSGADLTGNFSGCSITFEFKDDECWGYFSTGYYLIARRTAAASNQTVSLGFVVRYNATPVATQKVIGNYNAALKVSIIGL